MEREKLSFVVTKYKNRVAKVNFFDKKGHFINADDVKRVPNVKKVEFYKK